MRRLALFALAPVALIGLVAATQPSAGVPNCAISPTPTAGSMSAGQMVVWLEGQGISPNGAAGIVGNAQQENGLSPALNSGGLGLFQWTGARAAAVGAYAAAHGVPAESVEAQLGFLIQDLHGPYVSLLARLQAASSPQQAADDFEAAYERAGTPALTNREQYAVAALQAAGGASGAVPVSYVQGGGAVAQLLAAAQRASAANIPYSGAVNTTGILAGFRSDCSGFIDWLLSLVGLNVGGADTTALPSATGIQPGIGQDVTLWNRPLPGQAGHVIIDIGGQWFESGGGSGGGPHQMTPQDVLTELGVTNLSQLTGGVTSRGFAPLHLAGAVQNASLQASGGCAQTVNASSSTGKLKVGVMDLGSYAYAGAPAIFHAAGVTYTREDVGGGIGADCGAVCAALQNGIVPIVVYEGYPNPSGVVPLARRLEQIAQQYPIMNKMHVIEFGNEMWQGTSGPAESATTYGAQYDAAHRALAAAGLGSWKLLAAATAICGDQYSSPNWINQVIAAQSGGPGEIDGWTVHPYGPMNTDLTPDCPGPHGYGWPDVSDWHAIAVNAGSGAPWYVTEVGQCLGGGGCKAVDEQTQAADMTQYLTDAARNPWIAAFFWYSTYDDSTGWFGLLGNDQGHFGEPVNYQRPAFTALKNWIATNGEG